VLPTLDALAAATAIAHSAAGQTDTARSQHHHHHQQQQHQGTFTSREMASTSRLSSPRHFGTEPVLRDHVQGGELLHVR